ncbi:hypothetical protein [uncultured Hoeflea sp.]|uniref:hypothetical protein n=1 Tax=uncultured Hoeflea sp. TaxID=538666 RepID=UPI00262D79AF|nr:hypothetical protein [uncultured Hoeflea sp.]
MDQRAIIAANNNADLYAAMFISHGLGFERRPYVFVGLERPPPYYSNLTVLAPGHGKEITGRLEVLRRNFTGRIGLKDSFCELDLQSSGFDILLDASWIWRSSGKPSGFNCWERIETEADLLAWEGAWKRMGSPAPQRMFRASLLDRPDIVFLCHKSDGEIAAGCIANLSETCIGISNLFSRTQSAGVFAEAAAAVAAVAAVAPDLPITGYESGEDLDHAIQAGFETVGDLRVLVAPAAGS